MDEYELDSYQTDVIYEDLRDPNHADNWYFSPDGIGRVWFDSEEHAIAETGIEKVLTLT